MKKPTNLLDLMTPEDRDKVKLRQELIEAQKAVLISNEWMVLSKLGFYYDFDAIKAVLDDYITIPQANMFIDGAERVHARHVYDYAVATLAGTSTTKGSFGKLMQGYIDKMEMK